MHVEPQSAILHAGAAGVLVCPLTNARVVEIALVFGFSIATLVYCSASFSGAHAPPSDACLSISLGCLAVRRTVKHAPASVARVGIVLPCLGSLGDCRC